MSSLVVGMLMVATFSADTSTCKAKLGEWFDKRCTSVEVDGMTLRFVGTSRPYPQVAMACWNYEVEQGAQKTTFKQCHTGVLGGTGEFTLDGRAFVVDLDVPWCGTRVDRLGMVVWDKATLSSRYDERVQARAQAHPCEPARP
jgi:hypothetical protein